MRAWVLAGLLLGVAGRVQAHAFSPDAGHFYNGLGHAFVDPAQILLLLALALLALRRGMSAARMVILGVPVLALLASIVVRVPAWLPAAELALLGCATAAGLLVAWDRPLPRILIAVLVVAASLGLGIMNGAELAQESWLVPRLYLSGAALGIFFLLVAAFVAAGQLLTFRQDWTVIAVRVVGSWCLAGAAMLLALVLSL